MFSTFPNSSFENGVQLVCRINGKQASCLKSLLCAILEEKLEEIMNRETGLCDVSEVMLKMAFNPLPHMPTSGSSNSAANKDMMSKIWTDGIQLSD